MLLPNQITDTEIPVIDLSRDDQDTADQLVAAAATYGFLFIKSSGSNFSTEAVDATFKSV
jgi:hypothetical protein